MKAGGRQASRKEKLENLMNEFVSRRGWCSTSTPTRDDAASYLFLLIHLLVFLSALLLLRCPFQNYLFIFFPTLFSSLSNSLSSSLSTLSFSSSTTLLTAIFPPLLIPRTPFYSTLTLIPHHSDKRNWTICSSLMTSDEIQNIWALRNSASNSTSSRELDAVLIN